MSFFGGGTDYPAYYREHGGAVVGTTIDKYCYITVRYLPPFFEHKHRIAYSQTETVQKVDEIRHPSVREGLKFMGITHGIELHHDGDLPARTGLGSSSSFTVGLLHALYAMKGVMPSKMQLAKNAIHVEQELLREQVGSQDQTMAAFGGLNRIAFSGDHNIEVQPVTIRAERAEQLQSHLMLLFTGITRYASEVAEEQIKETPNKKRELAEMAGMVDEAIRILNIDDDLLDFGRLLDQSWQLKRSLSKKVSTLYVDHMYDTALKAGALGGKLLGAGGGGFMVLFVKPEDQPQVKNALGGILHVPFKFENGGSQIIFYEPDKPYG